MPRNLPPPRIPKSAEYLFSKTLDHVPTPWITTMWIEDGAEKIVKYRIFQRRRGHTIFVQTAPDSPEYPRMQRPVHATRLGMFDFREACRELIGLSHKTASSPPGYPHYVWNPSHLRALDRALHQRIVDEKLYAFLNPKRGRPKNPPLIGNAGAGLPIGTRLARRREILEYTTRMENLTTPLYERVFNGRMMRGYTPHQRALIQERVRSIKEQVDGLQQLVFLEQDVAPEDTNLKNSDSPIAPVTFDPVAAFDDVPEPVRAPIAPSVPPHPTERAYDPLLDDPAPYFAHDEHLIDPAAVEQPWPIQ